MPSIAGRVEHSMAGLTVAVTAHTTTTTNWDSCSQYNGQKPKLLATKAFSTRLIVAVLHFIHTCSPKSCRHHARTVEDHLHKSGCCPPLHVFHLTIDIFQSRIAISNIACIYHFERHDNSSHVGCVPKKYLHEQAFLAAADELLPCFYFFFLFVPLCSLIMDLLI